MRLRGEFILALPRVAAETLNWPNNVRREEFLGKCHTLLLLTSRSDVVKLVLNLANNFYESFGKFVSVANLLKKKKKKLWEMIILTEVLFSILLKIFFFQNVFFPQQQYLLT